MENVYIFYDHLVFVLCGHLHHFLAIDIFCDHLLYYPHLGILFQEKFAHPGTYVNCNIVSYLIL
jgi:hypothetical protein